MTREEVLNGGAGIVRRRDTSQPGAALLTTAVDGARDAKVPGASTSEVEYQLGRKVEQVVSAPGGVRRINVGVLLSAPLAAEQAQSLRQVIAMAVGLDAARGDDIAFSWVNGAVKQSPPLRQPESVAAVRAAPALPQPDWWPLAAGVGLLVLLPVGLLAARRRREPRLSDKEREEILARLKAWMAAEAPR
jgi:flagellar M-ring protein FliF